MAAEKKDPKIAEESQKAENRFSKEQLIGTERFRGRRDILEALLLQGEQYTVKDAEQKIEQFMKGRVK